MGWIKFTSFKTGKTYDSREPLAQMIITENVKSKDEVLSEQDGINREVIYRHPNGKDVWINDPRLAEVLGCEVDGIDRELESWK